MAIQPSAQPVADSPQPPATREDAREMVAGLSDEDVRSLLLEHLDRTLPEQQGAGSTSAPWVLTGSDIAMERLVRLLQALAGLGGEAREVVAAAGGGHAHPWLALLAAVLVSLAAGALLERFMLRPNGLMGGLDAIARTATDGRLSTGQVLLGGACHAVGALLFLVGAVLCLWLLPGLGEGVRLLANAAVWLVAGTRLVSSAIHALLLPAGGESPWPIRATVARTVARWLSVVAALVLLKQLDRAILEGLGAGPELTFLSQLLVGALLVGGVIVALFAVRRAMGPLPAEPGRRNVSWLLRDRWHLVASAYVLAVFVISIYAVLVTGESVFLRALASLSLILVIPVADYGLRLLAARLAPAPPTAPADETVSLTDELPGEPAADPAAVAAAAGSRGEAVTLAASTDSSAIPPSDEFDAPGVARTTHIERALLVNFRLLLALALLKAIAALWGVRLLDLVDAIFGDALGTAITEIVIAGVFAFIVWQIVRAALEGYAAPESDGVDLGGDGGGTGQTRVQTLMPVVAKTVAAALVLMLALIALSAFGVNIGPLLAGAGVIGLAVGFGAQTLVRDIVSGVFFLLDDAFRMGEYLKIGDIRGTVEKISVRSLRLRHHRGPLHTLPYGEIQSMTNYSRDYAIMKFEVRVPFETDVEKVRKLIKQVGAELAQNEEHASVMLEPLKSQGVSRMDDSAFVIRCKFTTVPGKQFTVRRVAFAMIQEAFAREGIKFAPKRVVVETVAPPGSPEALAAAAAASAAEPDEPLPRAAGDDR